MASQWGNNTLGPQATANWFFARANAGTGFLPILSVMPLTPAFNSAVGSSGGVNYPSWNELGVSTTWAQRSDGGPGVTYYMTVSNNSNNTIEYAFLEADL
jgi:hypothetical protein